ncbi:hypothetical protein [Rhodococcus sp. NCIMB 12038]|uniref:hypothetical protein n=1 Tax=Rhodococcus sp. NCIMB 12038 TaxID=933800 RepID=UPI000B3D2C67|nr:hypothetical protein [Rhodococcus sp. NCIMB 12038]OUS97433.1 hypothetical protein CA951_03570 [Rhodococcus sp. NCIMB 12038]
MTAEESGKPDVKQLLSEILKKVTAMESEIKSLKADLGKEVTARRDLADNATETLTDYGNAISSIQQGLFAMLSMHIDIVGPRRSHSDPEVAEEARNHAEMAMTAQADVAPTLFESLYGISAETGETLPGREAGVALERV